MQQFGNDICSIAAPLFVFGTPHDGNPPTWAQPENHKFAEQILIFTYHIYMWKYICFIILENGRFSW